MVVQQVPGAEPILVAQYGLYGWNRLIEVASIARSLEAERT